MRDRAADLAHGGGAWSPPTTRDAATVCLLRDGGPGLEVFLMRRTTSLAFAAGMHVYPGGAVDPGDVEVPLGGDVDLAATGLRTWSDRPGALLAAAARETFEECGVLLALGAGAAEVTDADRVAVADGALPFAALLAEYDLVVDAAALVPFAHWVTPEVEDRRYDTRFFLAALPPGQEARRLGGEADAVAWWPPADALAEHASGRMAMLPPTLATLALLAGFASASDALAAADGLEVVPLLPHPVAGADGKVVWHLLHDRTRAVLDVGAQPAASETDGTGAATAASP